jgi:hypothetical protein
MKKNVQAPPSLAVQILQPRLRIKGRMHRTHEERTREMPLLRPIRQTRGSIRTIPMQTMRRTKGNGGWRNLLVLNLTYEHPTNRKTSTPSDAVKSDLPYEPLVMRFPARLSLSSSPSE